MAPDRFALYMARLSYIHNSIIKCNSPRSGMELEGSSKMGGLCRRGGGGGGGGGGRMHWITECVGGGGGAGAGRRHGARNSLPGGAGSSSLLAPPIISMS